MAGYNPPKTTLDRAGASLQGGGPVITLTASASITGGQLVVVSGNGTVAPSSVASTAFVGVAGNDATNGQPVTVFTAGVQVLTASGTVTAGQTVQAATSGQVAAHTDGTNDGQTVGVALSSATNGQPVTVLVER